MQRFSFFIWLILSFSTLFSQDNFVKTFGGSSSNELLKFVHQASDGSIYCFGQTDSPSAKDAQLVFYKLDSSGNLKSESPFGTEQDDFIRGGLFNPTDNSFIICYESHEDGSVNSHVSKIDSTGSIIWDYEYGDSSSNEFLTHISLDHSSNILATGFASGTGFGNDFLLCKIDQKGNLIWDKLYGDSSNEVASSTIYTNGAYYVFGDLLKPNGKYGLYWIKTDTSGNQLDSDTSDWIYNSGCKNSTLSNDNYMYVIGESSAPTTADFDIYLAKFDSTGKMVWEKFLENKEKSDAGFAIKEVAPNQFLITGYSYKDTTAGTDAYGMLIDSGGNVLGKIYFDGNGGVDLGYSIAQIGDGRVLIAGVAGGIDFNNNLLVLDDINKLLSTEHSKPTDPSNIIIHLFPVPLTTNQLFIQSKVNISTIEVYNPAGIFLEEYDFNKNFGTILFDRPAGLYILHFITENNGSIRKRIIKNE